MQLWATWLLYVVLIDLTDEVTQHLQVPFSSVFVKGAPACGSYRGLYHVTQAFQRGEATKPVAYLVAHAKRLGILNEKRKNRTSPADLLHLTLAQKA